MNSSVVDKKEQKELERLRKKEEALRKIKLQEKTSFWMLLRYKYLTWYFAKRFVWMLFRLILLIGISYVILQPYITKISGSFMNRNDFVDTRVKLISTAPTLDTYKAIINDNKYFKALFNTTLVSLLCGVTQMLICAIVGYGFSKFKFKFKKIIFSGVLLTMIIPHDALTFSLFMQFKHFDIWGIVGMIKRLFGSTEVTPSIGNMINTYWPITLLAFTGLAFKNGLFIYIMRQYFNGVPDELEEAAYVDGAGVIKTFIRIILPMSVPMLVTIFMFAFSWQWTDTFYTGLFFTNTNKFWLFKDIIKTPASLDVKYAGEMAYSSAIRNTCGLLILLPLVIIYLFAQRTLIEGVERSGITG